MCRSSTYYPRIIHISATGHRQIIDRSSTDQPHIIHGSSTYHLRVIDRSSTDHRFPQFMTYSSRGTYTTDLYDLIWAHVPASWSAVHIWGQMIWTISMICMIQLVLPGRKPCNRSAWSSTLSASWVGAALRVVYRSRCTTQILLRLGSRFYLLLLYIVISRMCVKLFLCFFGSS